MAYHVSHEQSNDFQQQFSSKFKYVSMNQHSICLHLMELYQILLFQPESYKIGQGTFINCLVYDVPVAC